MSSKPKDHTKTIATMKSVIGDLKKSVNKITKEKEKEAEQAAERATPEDHQAALQHFATQYKMAKVNKDDAAAADHARAYHDYAHKLSNIYHKKLKEDMDICNICKVDPCVCDESHGFVNEGKMGEKAAGDLDFHPEIKNDDPPFDKPYKRKPATVTDKSGAKHTALSRVRDLARRSLRKEEVEQVDEISKELANRYMYSAFSDRKRTDDKMLDLQNKQSEGGKFFRSHKKISKLLAKSNNRTTGISRALDRLQKEEVEQVDELNVMTLSRYASKARSQSMDKNNPKRYKRGSGAAKAYDKIHRGEYSEGHVPDHSGVLNKSDAGTMSKVAALMAKERHGKSVPKKPTGEYDRKVTSYLKKKYQKEEVEQFDEAVTVDKKKYSWGKMITVHHGSDTSYPLHPEHQAAIKKLRPGMKTTFKDETGRQIHAHREGDQVHLVHHNTGSSTAKKTTVGYHHFDESYNPYDLHEIKMSDDEYSKNVENYGKRATNLLKHSWSQHDVSKEKEKAGDKAGAEKAKSTGSRAHKLFLKAWKKHESKPGNKEKAIQRTMSGASDYYRSKKPGQYTGD